MNTAQKEKIATLLKTRKENTGASLNDLSAQIGGVSAGYLSQILNSKWEAISDDMWARIGAFVGYTNETWNLVETRNFKMLSSLIKDSMDFATIYGITGEAGCGKTSTASHIAATTKGVYHVVCEEHLNKTQFLRKILRSMGRSSADMSAVEMLDAIQTHLNSQNGQVLILDEADKLTDNVFIYLVSLANNLEDRCGLIIMATSHLSKRLRHGIEYNKKGYNEIWSRIGRRFLNLEAPSVKDMIAIAKANGITDESQINSIVKDASEDIRRVKRLVHKHKRQASAQTSI
jgi:DNA transposition AAA+ family ATPase